MDRIADLPVRSLPAGGAVRSSPPTHRSCPVGTRAMTALAIVHHARAVRDDLRMPPARVRVVVADDHPLFREGIERAVRERPELELVGAAADGREALAHDPRRSRRRSRCSTCGCRASTGCRSSTRSTRDGLPTRVLILSASGDAELVYRAVQGGAAGYFRKEADREAILDAIAAVARGGDGDRPGAAGRRVRPDPRARRPATTARS